MNRIMQDLEAAVNGVMLKFWGQPLPTDVEVWYDRACLALDQHKSGEKISVRPREVMQLTLKLNDAVTGRGAIWNDAELAKLGAVLSRATKVVNRLN